MGKKSPSVPPPPDPTKMINAQSAANKDAIAESAKVNAVNMVGPNGTTTYGLNANGTPHTQYTHLTPEGQWLFDAQQAIGGELMQQAYNRTAAIPNSPFSLSGVPNAPQNYNTSGYEMFRPVSLPQGANAMGFQQPMNDPSNFFGGQFGGQQGGGIPANMQANGPGSASWAQQQQGGGGKGAGGQGGGQPPPGFAPQGGGFGDDYGNIDMSPEAQAARKGYATGGLSYREWQASQGIQPSAGMGSLANMTGPGGGGILANNGPGSGGAPPTGGSPLPWDANTPSGKHQDMSPYAIEQRAEADKAKAAAAAAPPAPTRPSWRDNDSMPAEMRGGGATSPWIGVKNAVAPGTPAAAPKVPGVPSFTGNKIDPTLVGSEPRMPQMPGGGQGPAPGGGQYPGGPPGGPGGQPGGGQQGGYYPGQPGGDMNVLPYDPRSYGNISGYVNQVQDAVYDQQMRNLQPSIDKQYDRQYQKLKDMGLPVGGEAWNSAIGELNRNVGNQYQQAANQAIAAGGEEANRRQGMEQGLRSTAWQEAVGTHQQQNSDIQQRMQIEQNLRNQAIQEMLMERNQGFNEASAFLQGAPAMGMPQAPQMQQYNMQAPDVIGAHLGGYNAQMNAYNAKNAASGSAWQGAANLAGAGAQIAMKCSRTFKCDDGEPERILEAVKKLPIRTWRYQPHIDPRQELHIGPYAEDWKRELGLGNGMEINVIDLCGVLLKSVQELSDEVAALRAEKVSFVKEPIMPRPPKAPKKTKRGAK